MLHPDPDDLALLALGESIGSTVDAHVADCLICTDEIAAFQATVGLAELSNYGEDAPQPGEHVWQAIVTELGLSGAQRDTRAVTTLDPIGRGTPMPSAPAALDDSEQQIPPQPDHTAERNGVSPLRSVPPPDPGSAAGPGTSWSGTSSPGSPGSPAVGAAEPSPGAAEPSAGASKPSAGASNSSPGAEPALPPPTPINRPGGGGPSRWSRWAAPLAAAVVGVAIGAGAVVLSQSRSENVTIEAIAPLKPVPDGPLGSDVGTLGEAELVAAGNAQQVRVSADQLPQSPNAYEVWLFGDDGKMVSLGTLNDRSGSFTVPQGISTQEYRVVDISDEAPDGNPAHSGISLIRGEFS